MHATLLAIHLVAMAAAIGIGIFLPVLAIQAARSAPEQVPALMGAAGRAAAIIGVGAVTVLWISGAWMAWGLGDAAGAGRMFDLKLGMVAVLTVIVFYNAWYGARARRTGAPEAAAAMSRRLGPILSLLGLAIVIVAVVTFN